MAGSTDIRVRFEPDDVALSRLHRAAFGGHEDGVAPWTARLAQHSLTWVGAFRSGEVVAFVNVCWDGGVHAFLMDTVVHPDHQRQGLGKAIVARAAGAAAESGCHWLHVDYQPPLADFYAGACGFRSTDAGLLRLTR